MLKTHAFLALVGGTISGYSGEITATWTGLTRGVGPRRPDIVENRPALSRWHPEYHDKFEQFLNAPDELT